MRRSDCVSGTLRVEIMESTVFEQLLSYYLNGEEALPKEEAERRKLKRMAPSFIVKDRRLFYTGPSMQYMRLVVLTPGEKISVLTECHSNPATGQHYGARNTQNRVIAGYYWGTLIADVKEWFRNCPHCQDKKTMKPSLPPSLHSQPPLTHPPLKEPWELLGLDLMGPLPETSRGNKYVVTVTDFHTKWVIAEPLKTDSAAEISPVITSNICMFGMAGEIVTHQGKDLVMQLNNDIFRMLKITNAISRVPRPKPKGQAVINNQSIKRAVRKCVESNPDDWDQYLSAVVYGINITKQCSTKHTPYFLLFRRHPRLPAVINACHRDDEFAPKMESDQQVVHSVQQALLDHASLIKKKMPEETSLDSSHLETKPLFVHYIDHPYAMTASTNILGENLKEVLERVQSLEREEPVMITTSQPTSSRSSSTI